MAIVEDVTNTGASLQATLDLISQANAEGFEIQVVGLFVVLVEGHDWEKTLGENATMVHRLGSIPVFRPNAYEPIPETL